MSDQSNERDTQSRHTWRVQGIPLSFDHNALEQAIRSASGFGNAEEDGENDVLVLTVAFDAYRRSQQATIRFTRTPSHLDRILRESRKPEYIFRISNGKGEDNRRGHQLKLDAHFIGQTVLYDPTSVGQAHETDIMAVSGLASHAYGSFVHKGDGHMWLADDLPERYPTARVILWGFNTQLRESTSFAHLDDLAHNLRVIIRRHLQSEIKRSMVLIGHSLGGLLIKEALSSLWEDPSQHDPLSRVKLMFFGVPNHGMHIGSLKAMVNDQPNRGLLESLEGSNSPVLQSLQRRFSETLKKASMPTFCFYETEQSPTAIQDSATGRYSMTGPRQCLVNFASATACLPVSEQHDRVLSIFRTHSELVKFSYCDPEYIEKVDYALGVLLQKYIQSTSATQGEQNLNLEVWPLDRDFRTTASDQLQKTVVSTAILDRPPIGADNRNVSQEPTAGTLSERPQTVESAARVQLPTDPPPSMVQNVPRMARNGNLARMVSPNKDEFPCDLRLSPGPMSVEDDSDTPRRPTNPTTVAHVSISEKSEKGKEKERREGLGSAKHSTNPVSGPVRSRNPALRPPSRLNRMPEDCNAPILRHEAQGINVDAVKHLHIDFDSMEQSSRDEDRQTDSLSASFGPSISRTSAAFGPLSQPREMEGESTVPTFEPKATIGWGKYNPLFDPFTWIEISPNGTHLGTRSCNGTVRLWDVASGRHLWTLTSAPAKVQFLSFSPDGRKLAGIQKQGRPSIAIWDTSTGQCEVEGRTSLLHSEETSSTYPCWSPDSRWVACAFKAGKVHLFDSTTGCIMRTLSVAKPCSLAFSPNGSLIATGSVDGKIRFWNTTSPRKWTASRCLKQAVTAMAFSKDGSRLLSKGFQVFSLWDVASRKHLTSLTTCQFAGFSADGQQAWTLSRDYWVDDWDLIKAEVTASHHLSAGEDTLLYPGMFSAGKWVKVSSGLEIQHVAEVIDLETGKASAILKGPPLASLYPYLLKFNGRYVVGRVVGDTSTAIWDIGAGN